VKSYENFDLTQFNSYRIKAKCAKAFFPDTEEDLIKVLRENQDFPKIILGNGNNIILSKDWYDTYFIIFNGSFDTFEVNGNEIAAEAGATMMQLSEAALSRNLSGFEIFYDIPSSVGGAVVMNAGSNEEVISDLVIKVRYLDLVDLTIKEKPNNELEFGYRNSFFQKNTDKIILKVWLRLEAGNASAIREKMENTKRCRWSKQPRDYPNCGSVFKRPEGKFVGPMLDELGFKGYSIGGAMVSPKHSGFIINIGNATGKDILSLVSLIQKRVREEYGLELILEQKVI